MYVAEQVKNLNALQTLFRRAKAADERKMAAGRFLLQIGERRADELHNEEEKIGLFASIDHNGKMLFCALSHLLWLHLIGAKVGNRFEDCNLKFLIKRWRL